ncbi:MAG: hypothetical protein KAX05_12755 [Bacteroidales bacterium]|nr:hypothetical protein [Bacteroidales bacterium]
MKTLRYQADEIVEKNDFTILSVNELFKVRGGDDPPPPPEGGDGDLVDPGQG